MKQACVNAHMFFIDHGIKVDQVASVHDEYQFVTDPESACMVGSLVVSAIQQAGKDYGFRCQLDGEYRVGLNWGETH